MKKISLFLLLIVTLFMASPRPSMAMMERKNSDEKVGSDSDGEKGNLVKKTTEQEQKAALRNQPQISLSKFSETGYSSAEEEGLEKSFDSLLSNKSRDFKDTESVDSDLFDLSYLKGEIEEVNLELECFSRVGEHFSQAEISQLYQEWSLRLNECQQALERFNEFNDSPQSDTKEKLQELINVTSSFVNRLIELDNMFSHQVKEEQRTIEEKTVVNHWEDPYREWEKLSDIDSKKEGFHSEGKVPLSRKEASKVERKGEIDSQEKETKSSITPVSHRQFRRLLRHPFTLITLLVSTYIFGEPLLDYLVSPEGLQNKNNNSLGHFPRPPSKEERLDFSFKQIEEGGNPYVQISEAPSDPRSHENNQISASTYNDFTRKEKKEWRKLKKLLKEEQQLARVREQSLLGQEGQKKEGLSKVGNINSLGHFPQPPSKEECLNFHPPYSYEGLKELHYLNTTTLPLHLQGHKGDLTNFMLWLKESFSNLQQNSFNQIEERENPYVQISEAPSDPGSHENNQVSASTYNDLEQLARVREQSLLGQEGQKKEGLPNVGNITEAISTDHLQSNQEGSSESKKETLKSEGGFTNTHYVIGAAVVLAFLKKMYNYYWKKDKKEVTPPRFDSRPRKRSDSLSSVESVNSNSGHSNAGLKGNLLHEPQLGTLNQDTPGEQVYHQFQFNTPGKGEVASKEEPSEEEPSEEEASEEENNDVEQTHRYNLRERNPNNNNRRKSFLYPGTAKKTRNQQLKRVKK